MIIPSYNEEKTISKVIQEIPDQITGVDDILIFVVDDGCTDNTKAVALEAGAHRVISLGVNRGLAFAFRTGLEEAIRAGADLIVNTDADFQYDQRQIPDLIRPILDEKADIVLGSRFSGNIEHMVPQKKIGNIIATSVTRKASGYPVTDAQTGFRAFSRDAAMRMNVLSDYTYVQETIMQAVNHNLRLLEVPIDFRKREGSSRLMSNVFNYAKRASSTILRTYRDYHPLEVFSTIALLFIFSGTLVGFRVIGHYLTTGMVSPYLPSAVLTTVLWIVGVLILVFGLIADMLKTQRQLQEEILYRLKRMEYDDK